MASIYSATEPCALGFCSKGFCDGSGSGSDWEISNGKTEGGPRVSSGLSKGSFVWRGKFTLREVGMNAGVQLRFIKHKPMEER